MTNKLFLVIALLGAALSGFGQTALTSTTLSAAITVNQQTFSVVSTTGMTATNPKTLLYVIDKNGTKGELMTVTAVPSSTSVTVIRGSANRSAHVSGAYVVISGTNPAQSFQTANPNGPCTAANTLYTPWINTYTGEQFLCSTLSVDWVHGWNTPSPFGVTADVASAAGLVVPGGPLFTMTGTSAITGFTLPVGFAGGSFCTMPTGAFTWTTATNIGLAGTAVVGRVLCFTWNSSTGKWYPSYV